MADGFRRKPILRANQRGSAKEVLCWRPWSQDGWPSFRLAHILLPLLTSQSVASPLSLTCALQPFFLIALLTFSHWDRDPLVYAFIVWEFHEPWTQGCTLLIIFPHHYITAFHRISLVVFFISSSLFYLLSVLLHILSTLSGDPPQFITWRVVTSLPLSIPRTLVERFLVEKVILLERVFCYRSARERVYPLLISSLGLILFMFRVCTFVYM